MAVTRNHLCFRGFDFPILPHHLPWQDVKHELEVWCAVFWQLKLFYQTFLPHINENRLQHPFLKQKWWHNSNHLLVEFPCRSQNKFIFTGLEQTLAELADRVRDCWSLLEDLLAYHVYDLYHWVEKHSVLVVKLLASLEKLGFGSTFSWEAFLVIWVETVPWAGCLLRCLLIESIVDPLHIMPGQVVKVNLLQLLLEQIVDAPLCLRSLGQLPEPSLKKHRIFNCLQRLGTCHFMLYYFLLDLDDTPIWKLTSVLQEKIMHHHFN